VAIQLRNPTTRTIDATAARVYELRMMSRGRVGIA
jgi:hypothetical protein